MANDIKRIVNRAADFAHVLLHSELSYMAYTGQMTFLLFVKMTRPPWHRRLISVPELGWPNLLKRSTRLRQSIVKRAFEGQLVPPDSADEPANALLSSSQYNSSIPRARG
jgi:hypothetical protein